MRRRARVYLAALIACDKIRFSATRLKTWSWRAPSEKGVLFAWPIWYAEHRAYFMSREGFNDERSHPLWSVRSWECIRLAVVPALPRQITRVHLRVASWTRRYTKFLVTRPRSLRGVDTAPWKMDEVTRLSRLHFASRYLWFTWLRVLSIRGTIGERDTKNACDISRNQKSVRTFFVMCWIIYVDLFSTLELSGIFRISRIRLRSSWCRKIYVLLDWNNYK